MAKCIRMESGKIRRVPNHIAKAVVNMGHACFIPKSEWKVEVRDVIKEGKS